PGQAAAARQRGADVRRAAVRGDRRERPGAGDAADGLRRGEPHGVLFIDPVRDSVLLRPEGDARAAVSAAAHPRIRGGKGLMNRSVLLVICDFLILTLLSFVQFETTEPVVGSAPGAGQEVSAPAMSNMVATLEAALEAERQRRSVLTNALAAREAELQQRLAVLAEREQRLSHVQDRLTQSEAEARRLAEERARLERSQSEAAASV